MHRFFEELLFNQTYRKTRAMTSNLIAGETQLVIKADFPLNKITMPVIHKYATFIRLSEKDQQSLYLQRVYNRLDGCWTLPTNEDIEVGLQHVIPLELITVDNIELVNTGKSIQQFVHPIKQFFGCAGEEDLPLEGEA